MHNKLKADIGWRHLASALPCKPEKTISVAGFRSALAFLRGLKVSSPKTGKKYQIKSLQARNSENVLFCLSFNPPQKRTQAKFPPRCCHPPEPVYGSETISCRRRVNHNKLPPTPPHHTKINKNSYLLLKLRI